MDNPYPVHWHHWLDLLQPWSFWRSFLSFWWHHNGGRSQNAFLSHKIKVLEKILVTVDEGSSYWRILMSRPSEYSSTRYFWCSIDFDKICTFFNYKANPHELFHFFVTDTPKVSVVLRGQNDWRAWYGNIKTTAKARLVWDYIDPELQSVHKYVYCIGIYPELRY